MIEVQMCLMMFCDKCKDDIREHHYIPVSNKEEYDILYEDFLQMAKEEGWERLDGRCLCPECALRMRMS